MWKIPKMSKKWQNLKNRSLFPSVQPESDFSRTYHFLEVVDNVDLITYKKFQNILIRMQRYGQKTLKISPQMGVHPICEPPRFFFKNRALSLLYPYGALASCKKLEKLMDCLWDIQRRTNRWRTDKGDYKDPSGKPGVQKTNLNWLSGINQPEISFSVTELSSRVGSATVADILAVNRQSVTVWSLRYI